MGDSTPTSQSWPNEFIFDQVRLKSKLSVSKTKLLKHLAIQVDGYHGLTPREMALIVNVELVKGNAEHAARVRSRAWKAWYKQRQRLAGLH
jgi:hypothetical protein